MCVSSFSFTAQGKGRDHVPGPPLKTEMVEESLLTAIPQSSHHCSSQSALLGPCTPGVPVDSVLNSTPLKAQHNQVESCPEIGVPFNSSQQHCWKIDATVLGLSMASA